MATLVVALDMPEAAPAIALAQKLQGSPVWLKVGLELFTAAGPDLVRRFKDMGFHVFLDLKLHDIPNTVHGAVLAAHTLGVDMLTLHTLGGERMAKAAVAALDTVHAPKPLLLGVTILTSTAQGELPGHTGPINVFATELAASAKAWGLNGVVSSGFEVSSIRQHCPAPFICLTPGIRPAATSAHDDQRRVMTPAQAVQAGSDYLVVGRPITQAMAPEKATRTILDEMATASPKGYEHE